MLLVSGFTGRDGREPSSADIQYMIEEHPDANIGVRLPKGVLGLDVDAYGDKNGDKTIAELEERLGPLPPTYSTTSRGEDQPSRIYLFQVPPDLTWRDDLAGVDLIHEHLRYIVVEPSKHPDTGERYRWYGPDSKRLRSIPHSTDPTRLPESWVDHLSAGSVEDGPYKAQVDDTQIKEWWSQAEPGPTMCQRVQDQSEDLIAFLNNPGGKSRHTESTSQSMALVGLAAAGHPGVADALKEVGEIFVDVVTEPGEGQRTRSQAVKEWRSLIGGATKKAMVDHPQPKRSGDPCHRVAVDVVPESPKIPDDVWEARPELEHIRQAAWNRGRSADAVLSVVLPRIAAGSPHTLRLPAIVGSSASLSFLTALVGPPGSGKSNAASIGKDLIASRNIKPECDGVPIGSGEGIIELLFEWKKERNEQTGKYEKIKRQTRHNAYIYVDEGEVMIRTAARKSGSTFAPTIRTIFTGGVLGQTNAGDETRRLIPQGQALYGIVFAFQPAIIEPIFGEAGAGTPQRFYFASATVPSPPPKDRSAYPGSLEVPDLGRLGPYAVDRGGPGYSVHELVIPRKVELEVAERDHQKQQHGTTRLNEHQDLMQLKVAAILAILQGRLDMSIEDWQLAESLCEVSRQVRDNLLADIHERSEGRELAAQEMMAQRSVASSEATRQFFVIDTAELITKKITEHPGDFAPGTLSNQVSPARREVLEDSLDHAFAIGWIHVVVEPGQGEDKQRYYPGNKEMN